MCVGGQVSFAQPKVGPANLFKGFLSDFGWEGGPSWVGFRGEKVLGRFGPKGKVSPSLPGSTE